MKNYKEYNSLQQYANAFARSQGHGSATEIRINGRKTEIIDYTSYGHRKNTTGEYVPNAYLAKFGWKNTYYQHAETIVGVPRRVANHFAD